ncbi:MAG: peptidylprolyl isomerase [Bacteroidales bacterium]|nr:peptidylprolyl isomerase [Bacteroidales bacterium]
MITGKSLLSTLLLAGTMFGGLSGQSLILDRVVAVVGEFMILQSDIESLNLQNKAQGVNLPGDEKCVILENFLSEKLLLNQAKIDSIEVSESSVEMELDNRLSYFISMIGSPEALEEYFGKTILEIKEDMRKAVRDASITRQMQSTITGEVTVTPSEIREYYNGLSRDSIPYIDSKVELSQITRYPPVDEAAIFEVKQTLLDLRRRILDGEKFTTLAVLYSEGPSASQGGEIGFMGKGELDAEYAKAAYSLKAGGVSTIVESSFGYHIIQLIERREERVNTRHILMKPKVKPESIRATTRKLDSIANLVRTDSVEFDLAARIFSQDKNTAVNGGIMVNPGTNTTAFMDDELQPSEFIALRDLKVGEITEAFKSEDENGKEVYKIVRLRNRSSPHRASLKEDYMVLKELALGMKKQEVFQQWIDEKIGETYISVDNSFAGCDFSRKGWVK